MSCVRHTITLLAGLFTEELYLEKSLLCIPLFISILIANSRDKGPSIALHFVVVDQIFGYARMQQ